jgi:zinc D-Ala-D-Ala carboxypeptidase
MQYILEDIDYGRVLKDSIPGAPNFQFGDFVSSETAVRMGIANIPSEEEWLKIEALAVDVLQPLRNKFGPIIVNSGYRCKKLNNAIGSSDSSFHRTGGGADVESPTVPLLDILEEAIKLPIAECIAEFFPHGWVHIGYIKGDDRRNLKLKDSKHNYSKITLEELQAIYKR